MVLRVGDAWTAVLLSEIRVADRSLHGRVHVLNLLPAVVRMIDVAPQSFRIRPQNPLIERAHGGATSHRFTYQRNDDR
jgi:hypothetical protein